MMINFRILFYQYLVYHVKELVEAPALDRVDALTAIE